MFKSKAKSPLAGQNKKQRIWELDFLRGICVLLMVFDHIMFNIGGIFGEAWASETNSPFFISMYESALEYSASSLRLVTQKICVWIFAGLCGISCSFSRSNLKRGILLGIISYIITVVTTMMDMEIRFGILHMLTVAILTWWLLDMICRHNRIRTASLCLAVGVCIVIINYLLMGIYAQDKNAFTSNSDWYFIGDFMIGASFYSADYYPIFPSVGYMLIGAALAPMLYWNRRSLFPKLGKYDWYAPINTWGKIALWIYITHQVLITGLMALISFLFITKGDFVLF